MIGLQYPFHRSAPGRTVDPATFWEPVSSYLATHWSALDVRVGWPEDVAGGVPAVPDRLLQAAGDVDLLRSMAGLQSAGCRAIAVADMQDPAVPIARSVLDVPVVGALEASVTVARIVGHRPGFVTARPLVSGAAMARNLAGLGLLAPTGVLLEEPLEHWDYGLLAAAMSGRHNALVADLERAVGRLVDQGSDVIIPVCVFWGPALAAHRLHRIDDTPVVDPLGAVLQVASALAGLHAATGLAPSREHGLHRRSPIHT